MKVLRMLVAVVAAVVLVTGCSRTAPIGPTTPTTRGTGSVTGDWQGVGAFADAVMAEDLQAAATHVVPASPAARYLQFQSDFIAADPAHPKPTRGSWGVNVDQHLGQVTIGIGGGSIITWTDWRFGPDGRILQWSTPTSGALEARLWTASLSAPTPAGTVKLASALVNDTTLSVVLEVSASGVPLTSDCTATYATASPGSSGPSANATPAPKPAATCLGPSTITATTPGRVALQFADAGLGGILTYVLRDAAGAELATVRLAVA